ncbi:hypothetical protein BaRGS_00000101 [Batillaria attramentaria]|uniref:Uncharacterized protein n=1 Tax=Batillaria attramentaria TaxID=370345 RepID=A0ABD0M9C9_9CAEN
MDRAETAVWCDLEGKRGRLGERERETQPDRQPTERALREEEWPESRADRPSDRPTDCQSELREGQREIVRERERQKERQGETDRLRVCVSNSVKSGSVGVQPPFGVTKDLSPTERSSVLV